MRRANEGIVEDMEKRWKQREIAKIYMAEEMEKNKERQNQSRLGGEQTADEKSWKTSTANCHEA